MAETISVRITRQTAARYLKQDGMRTGIKKLKPFISRKMRRDRLHFAEAHKEWTVADWERVIWPDVTKVSRYGHSEQLRYWKRVGETLNPRHVKQVVKHGGGSVMIWGCLTCKGPGYICQITSRLNSELYLTILAEELVYTMNYFKLNPQKVIFQQDNFRFILPPKS